MIRPVLSLLALAGPVLAGPLAIEGDYGNAAGCEELRTGAYLDDEMMILTPSYTSSYATTCEFVDVAADSLGNQRAAAICHFEGEDILGALDFVVSPLWQREGYRVFLADGSLWGEFEPCI